jgi:hypothetical protein
MVKVMLSGMAALWKDALGRPRECIHRYGAQLVGLTDKNKLGSDRITLVRQLAIGSRLVLLPEPDNSADPNAILVYSEDDLSEDLGYLKTPIAEAICRMMECGATFSAEVRWIDSYDPKRPEVFLFMFQLTDMIREMRPIRREVQRDEVHQPQSQSPPPGNTYRDRGGLLGRIIGWFFGKH